MSTYYHEQVYQPAEDTILLYETALREIKPGDRVIEIGTGSGYISSGLKDMAWFLIAVDINPFACISARRCGCEVIRADLLSGICGIFDLVLFNPPYLPTGEDEKLDDWLEYALDGGKDGRETIRRFAGVLDAVLSKKGRCLLLVSSLTGAGETGKIFSDLGFITFIAAERKVEDESLFILRITRDLCRC